MTLKWFATTNLHNKRLCKISSRNLLLVQFFKVYQLGICSTLSQDKIVLLYWSLNLMMIDRFHNLRSCPTLISRSQVAHACWNLRLFPDSVSPVFPKFLWQHFRFLRLSPRAKLPSKSSSSQTSFQPKSRPWSSFFVGSFSSARYVSQDFRRLVRAAAAQVRTLTFVFLYVLRPFGFLPIDVSVTSQPRLRRSHPRRYCP